MMSVSRQTQNWSKTPQEPDAPSDNKNTLSATDKEKLFGDQDLGAVLNKVADHNYIDPTKKPRGVGNANLDKDAFLKLLLTQMKNQDPTNPLKSHEMAAQLAQFTSLEKLTNIDESVNGLRKDQAPTLNYEALNLIGKTVSGDSAKVERTDTKSAHAIRFQLRADAQKVKIDIKGDEGKVVRTIELNNLKAGKNEISWNGQLDDGTVAKPGEYRVVIEAKNLEGKKVWADTKFEGLIDGITFTAQGPLLSVGNQQVRFSDVEKLGLPPPPQPAPGPEVPLKSQEGAQAAPPLPKSASNEPMAVKSNLMNSVPMNGKILEQLKKQGVL
jgi:flagellar basal-body rod modification protein FlgD